MVPAIKLSDEEKNLIVTMALESGASKLTFLNINDYKSPASPDPQKVVHPDVRSFIVTCYPDLRGSFMCQDYTRSFDYSARDTMCHIVARRIGRYIEDNYDADVVALPFHRPFSVTEKTFRRVVAPVSYRHAAVQSGMGVFGKNTIVITPKWGSMVFFHVLATTLDIDSTPPLEGFNPCEDCTYPCVKNCPANAIVEEDDVWKVLQNRCTKYSQPYDVGNYMRAQLKMLDMTLEEKKQFIQSPHFFNLYQSGMQFLYYRCIECQRGCPVRVPRPQYREKIKIPNNATNLQNPFNPKYDIFKEDFTYANRK
jgi:hypothetical protein